MKLCFLIPSLLASSVLGAAIAGRQAIPAPTALINLYLTNASSYSSPHAAEIVQASKNATSEATFKVVLERDLPQITAAFVNLDHTLSGFVTPPSGSKPDATLVTNGLSAFLQVFSEADLALFESKYRSQVVAQLSSLLSAYCQATRSVLLQLQRLLTGADTLSNRLAGGFGLTPEILDALHLNCLDKVLVPCVFGPPGRDIPICPCPPGQVCAL